MRKMIPPFRLSSFFVWLLSTPSRSPPPPPPPPPSSLLGGGVLQSPPSPPSPSVLGGGDGAGDTSWSFPCPMETSPAWTGGLSDDSSTGKLHETVPSGLTVAVASPTPSPTRPIATARSAACIW